MNFEKKRASQQLAALYQEWEKTHKVERIDSIEEALRRKGGRPRKDKYVPEANAKPPMDVTKIITKKAGV